jgi:hypothetical protein
LIELDRSLGDCIRRGETQSFADIARRQVGYVSLTSSAIDLAAAGKTTLAEAIATTSGLDDPLEETRTLKTLTLPESAADGDLADSLLSREAR